MAEFQQTRIDTSEYQHPITTPEQLPPPNFSKIAQRVEVLNSDLLRADEVIFDGPNGEFVGMQDDSHPVTRIANSLVMELGDPDDLNVRDFLLDVRSRLETHEPQVFGLVSSAIDEKIHTEVELEALNRDYGEAMTGYRDAAIEQLAAHTDWNRIVEVVVADGWPEEASMTKDEAFNHLYKLSQTGVYDELDKNFQQAQSAERLSEFAQSIGGMLEEPNPKPEEGWFGAVDMPAHIDTWSDVTKKVFNYMNARHKGTADRLLAELEYPTLSDLKMVARDMELGNGYSAKALLPLATAFERHLTSVFDDYDNREAAANQAEVNSRPNVLYIGTAHRELLEQNAGISDVPTWIFERLQRFHNPKRSELPLSSGIGFIEFTNNSDDVGHDGIYIAGELEPKENRLFIDIEQSSKREFDKIVQERNYVPEAATRKIAEMIGNTFDHEVGHHMHRAVLSVKELRIWQAALDAEPDAHFNEYIESLVKQKVPEARMQTEQFATRLETYMNEPLDLAFKYPKSFAALNGILGKFNGGNVEVLMSRIRSLQESGRTGDAERLISFFKYGPTS